MKVKGLLLIFGVAIAAILFLPDASSRQFPTPQPIGNIILGATRAYPTATPTPQPTPTIIPTQVPYTPYPTQIPYTPYPTQNYIGEYREGGKIDQIMDVWFGRVMVMFLLMVAAPSLGALLFKMRELDKEREFELELAKNKLAVPVERPIVIKSSLAREDVSESPLGVKIKTDLLKDFVANHREVGLQVTKWKSRPGWNQKAIENVLDWLAHYDFITPRTAGISCVWKENHSAKHLFQLFNLNNY